MNTIQIGLFLVTSTSVAAQVTLDVRVARDFTVRQYFNRPFSSNPTQTIKLGTPIPSPTSLVVGTASASFSHSNTAGRVRYTCSMMVRTYTGTRGELDGTVLIWMKSRMPVQGKLTVGYQTARGAAGQVAHGVDSSAINPPLSLGPTAFSKTYQVTLDSTGLWIGHASSMSSFYGLPGSLSSTVSIDFEPDVYLAQFGNSCGPILAAKHDTQNQIHLSASGLATGAPLSAFLVGDRSTSVPLPGGCVLLTNPLILVPWSVSGGGTASFGMARLPGQLTAYVQAVEVRVSGAIRTSNGIRIDLR